MTLILKRNPVWMKLLLTADTSAFILLSGDHRQVSVPASLLLAASPLLRSIMTDLLSPAYSPCFLSFPAASREALQVMVDILATGTAVGKHGNKIEEVKQALEMLGIDASLAYCQLEDIDKRYIFKQEIKVGNHTDGSDESLNEERIKAVKLEEKGNENTEYYEAFGEMCSKFEKDNIVESSQITEDPNSISNPLPRCCECDKSFVTKCSLKQHTDGIHPRRRIPCNLCQQTFSQKIV